MGKENAHKNKPFLSGAKKVPHNITSVTVIQTVMAYQFRCLFLTNGIKT